MHEGSQLSAGSKTACNPASSSSAPATNAHGASQHANSQHWLFGICALLCAFLLFEVQPMMGKQLLPRFGGSAAVWMGCMLFFQTLLLLGYAFADAVVQKTRGALQVTLALAPFFVAAALHVPHALSPFFAAGALPLIETVSAPAVGASGPPLWLLVQVLLLRAGLPFFALATAAPLLQHWYASPARRSPYSLYAASNVGSLGGLLAYPFVIEPWLSTQSQHAMFGLGLGLAAFSVTLCARIHASDARERARVMEDGPPSSEAEAATDAHARTTQMRGPARLSMSAACRVAVLAAVPSAMLLAVTSHLTLDVAPVPLLWVLPLALYLAAFALAFGSARARDSRLVLLLFASSSLVLGANLMLGARSTFAIQLASALVLLFSASLLVLSELWQTRPSDAAASRYYLAVAAGGVVGTTLVTVVSPLILNQAYELPLCVAATYAILLARRPYQRSSRATLFGRLLWLAAGMCLPMLTAPLFWRDTKSQLVEETRSFYGTLRVTRDAQAVRLSHGRIVHGMQFSDPARSRLPTLYFGPESGVGLVLERHRSDQPRAIGVVGLGVGTLASYAHPADHFTFYELDPNVIRAAQRHFTFLRDAPAPIELQEGDGRLLLERAQKARFDVLVLDAFASDSVPVHLLTVDAFTLYAQRLSSDGILVANIINRHLDLDRVIAGSARALGFTLWVVDNPADLKRGLPHARWALMARSATTLAEVIRERPVAPISGEPVRFRDDFSNLASVLHGLRGLY